MPEQKPMNDKERLAQIAALLKDVGTFKSYGEDIFNAAIDAHQTLDCIVDILNAPDAEPQAQGEVVTVTRWANDSVIIHDRPKSLWKISIDQGGENFLASQNLHLIKCESVKALLTLTMLPGEGETKLERGGGDNDNL